ncbi:MAG: CPBP family intramembrane metalloprotease [Deltaproteobacteria bacterium]|nr:MAG: CPBP family intramembrane metalloprotease [Deltaproteobacteria bacterium]
MPRRYPALPDALLLVALCWLLAQLAGAVLVRPLGVQLGVGAGLTIAVVAVTAFAWRALPEPRGERVGLRGIGLLDLACVALLIPVAFAGSELEQLVRSAFPPPDLEAVARSRRALVATETPRHVARSVAVIVLLAPALEEWLFRGLLQRGLSDALGSVRGILVTSALFGLWHGSFGLSVAAWSGAFCAAFVYGILLGILRHRSGSLIAPLLLHAGINGMAVLGAALRNTLPIPVWNAPGTHVPGTVLVPALLAVCAGVALALRGPR